jgi:hypothetical protein
MADQDARREAIRKAAETVRHGSVWVRRAKDVAALKRQLAESDRVVEAATEAVTAERERAAVLVDALNVLRGLGSAAASSNRCPHLGEQIERVARAALRRYEEGGGE